MAETRLSLARYGRSNRMEWFENAPELVDQPERGQAVVLLTSRGEELGEVLVIGDGNATGGTLAPTGNSFRSQILRIADAADCQRALTAEVMRGQRFEECHRLLVDGRWPVEVLDVTLLLDGRTTVVDILKSDDFDLTALRAQFREWYDFDVILESQPTTPNAVEILIAADPTIAKSTKGGCGSGGCGSCGSQPARPVATVNPG